MRRQLGSGLRVARRGRWVRAGLAVDRGRREKLVPLSFPRFSEEDQNTFKRNMGPLCSETFLELVFALKIRLKRSAFKVFKPGGKKVSRSVFFVGSEERKDGIF